jgi:hypothetical protein
MSKSQLKLRIRQGFFLIAILLVSFFVPLAAVRAEVVLDYFVASAQDDGVLLEWETLSESDSNGFYLHRSTKADSDFTRLNIFFLSDSETGEGVFYSYLDDQVVPGFTYYYKLEAIDFNGSRTMYGPVSVNYKTQSTRTPTATLRGGNATAMPTITQTPTLGTVSATQRTPTPTLTPTGLVLLLSSQTPSLSPTPSPSPTPAEDVTVEPTQTPTLEPLPAFEFLFPAPTTTPIASPTALKTQITPEPELSAQTTAEPLTKRHAILLGIILLLWFFLLVFLVFLIRNFALHLEEADEANG